MIFIIEINRKHMDSAEPALSYTQRLFCCSFSHSMCLTKTHTQTQTNCFHILFPDARSCKQHVPVKWLCLALSRASADRQTDRASAHSVSVAYWFSVCMSVSVDPFFPCDTATPSHCSPPATACQGNKWPPIPPGNWHHHLYTEPEGNVRKHAFI